MENKELNDRIIKNVKNRIVVSNLESEEKMKLAKKTQVLSLAAVIVLFLSGGFITVNATTDGKLVDDITDKIKVVFVNNNKEEKELKGKVYTDSDGNECINYEYENENYTFKTDINKTELEKNNMTIEEKTFEDNGDAKIEMYIK